MKKISTTKGRTLKATPVFDTYWRFAAKRQEIFMKRVKGLQGPWIKDEILAKHRFTNVYRASDRVSQYLIKKVIYSGPQDIENIFFRTLLFKIFNKIETWEAIEDKVGEISINTYNFRKYSYILDRRMSKKIPNYSAAYIMPSPHYNRSKKHKNHLKLIEFMLKDGAPRKVVKTKSLKELYEIILSYPSLGSFLAFQFSIDLNYSPLTSFSEFDFVVAGPGAQNGIKKCFYDDGGLTYEEIIYEMAVMADREFDRLNLNFKSLWGRPLQLIDCQNLFCEVDKYARLAHPEFQGKTKRTKIKQKYSKSLGPVPQWYPPKWNLKVNKKDLALLKTTSDQISFEF